ncbi:MAG: hypothetical protein A4E62_01678 [Syntrophorhabdus sp. PtaU1.Bin002]|nr:MAG: hypothetical protein A4E62_01678 [Syntrophorhabdus sp. PtaU1.Bin002]
MNINVFGFRVRIEHKFPKLEKILNKNLSVYRKSESNDFDIEIWIDRAISAETHGPLMGLSKEMLEGGFTIHNRYYDISYYMAEKMLRVMVSMNKVSSLRKVARKVLNYEFNSMLEEMPQIIHEMILVPATFLFNRERVLVHASCFKKDERTIMIGGTGGMGKTSLEMRFCRDLGYSFVADDICVLDREGFVYPNLSFPKIYCYNTFGDKELEIDLLKEYGMLNKLHWGVIKHIRGPSSVRRKANPSEFYTGFESDATRVTDYYILTKCDSIDRVTEEPIPSDRVAQNTRLVIENEYRRFTDHLQRNDIDRIRSGNPPRWQVGNMFAEWEKVYANVFERTNCSVLRIPPQLEHSQSLASLAAIIDDKCAR